MTDETLEQKIARLQQVPKGDSDYDKNQLFLANIFQNKNRPDKAIEYLSNIPNDSPNYPEAQFRLGNIFQYKEIGGNKTDKKEAIKYYENVKKDASTEFYAIAQFNLGEIYKEEKDTAESILHYKNVSHSDSPEAYALAQYQLAKIYERDKGKHAAKESYNNVEMTGGNFDEHTESRIRVLFEEIPKSKKDKIIKNIIKIHKICKDIRNQLFIKFDKDNKYEKTVAHYTNPATVFALLAKSSPFRLNLVDFMNDSSENKVLLNWLEINPEKTIQDRKNFVASFSFNHNSLNQFRLYGLEDKLAASGISLTLKSTFFSDKIRDKAFNRGWSKSSDSEIIDEDTIFPLPLFRCIYFDPQTNYLALAKRNKQSFYLTYNSEDPKKTDQTFQKYIKFLKEEAKVINIRKQLDIIRKEKNNLDELLKSSFSTEESENINRLIVLATMPIACLVKHAAFEDENECRIFYDINMTNDKIQIDYKQFYLNYKKINEDIDKIYLGPKCQPQHELWLKNYNKIEKLNIRRIIKSTMPLQ